MAHFNRKIQQQSGSNHDVTYGTSSPLTAGTIKGQVYQQTSTGTSTGVLMNSWTWDGTQWFNESQPINLTRAQLLALRNAGQLRQSQHYLITDHVQGRLVAGTTILVHATADNEISENVTVNTTYDNEGWRGIYDIDKALVLELQDNRNNIARGINGTEVANFDWGNTSYTNALIDNATLTANIGNTAQKQNITVSEGSILNLTGFTGAMVNFEVKKSANVNFTNANGTWRLMRIWDSSSFNASGYTGGGDNYYNTIWGASNINFSNTTQNVILRQNDLQTATITNSGVTTAGATFNLSQSKLQNSTISRSATVNGAFVAGSYSSQAGTVTHSVGTMTLNTVNNYVSTISQTTDTASIMTLTQVEIKKGSNILNNAGVLAMTRTMVDDISSVSNVAGSLGTTTINESKVDSGSNITRSATATAGMTITYSYLHGNCAMTQSGGATTTLTRVYETSNSSISLQAGSGGTVNITDTSVNNSSIVKLSTSTAGTLSISGGTKIDSASFVQTSGTGNITLVQCSMEGISGVNITGGNRNYTFRGLVQSGVSRATLSGTGTITDNHSEVEMHYRGTYNNSCSGAANIINYSEITGLSGALNLTGTTGGKSLNRVKIYNGQLTSNNNPNSAILQLWSLRDAGVVNITANATGDVFNYVDVDNQSNVLINKTSVSNISGLKVTNSGTYNMTGSAGAVSKVLVEQGTLNHSGGTLTNVSKKMTSTFTVTGGTQNNVHHWDSAAKTTAVNNTNRVDYLGLGSAAAIL